MLNATELFTLQQLILFYVTLTWIENKNTAHVHPQAPGDAPSLHRACRGVRLQPSFPHLLLSPVFPLRVGGTCPGLWSGGDSGRGHWQGTSQCRGWEPGWSVQKPSSPIFMRPGTASPREEPRTSPLPAVLVFLQLCVVEGRCPAQGSCCSSHGWPGGLGTRALPHRLALRMRP